MLFHHKSTDPQSLSNNIVNQVMMDSENNIWLATGGGLNKIIKGTENKIPKFLNWRTTQSGLPNDDVYCIVDGGDSTLWLACGNMISHFFPKQNSFQNYNKSDGLSGGSFRGMGYLGGKGLRSQDGTMYFGGIDGLTVFHPDSIRNNDFIPKVVITNFLIRNQVVPVDSKEGDSLTFDGVLPQSISYTKKIQLDYNQNDFNLEFAALNFDNPEQNVYKYKLEPYEKEWIRHRRRQPVGTVY